LHFREGNLDRLIFTREAGMTLYPDNVVGLALVASSTQTANLLEVQNNSSNPLFWITTGVDDKTW